MPATLPTTILAFVFYKISYLFCAFPSSLSFSPFQMSSLFLFLRPHLSLVALSPLFSLPGLLFHLFSSPPMKTFLLPFIHPSVISSHSFLLFFLPIYLISFPPQHLLRPSISRLPMVNLFIFSLSIIRPGVFCSIYHLDETLPQFISTHCELVHTCTQACLLLFLLTRIQQSLANIYANTNTDVLSNKLFSSKQKGKKLPILFVSFLIITFLCLLASCVAKKLSENISRQSLAMLYMCLSVCVYILCTCVSVLYNNLNNMLFGVWHKGATLL